MARSLIYGGKAAEVIDIVNRGTLAEALKGKILLLLPDGMDKNSINTAFFGADAHNPLALERLVLRGF